MVFCRGMVPFAFFSLALASFASPLQLASLFGDGAVLQRGRKVPVWGWAGVGDVVTVEFAGQRKSSVADSTGAWRIDLDPLETSAVPRGLTVSAVPRNAAEKTGVRKITLSDILVGEVWLCSGQSNMQQPLGSGGNAWSDANGSIEAALTHDPLTRFAKSPAPVAASPRKTVSSTNCTWKPFLPGNLGSFGAVPYHFAVNVRRGLPGVPIGLLWCSVGGSNIRPWISREGFAAVPELDDLEKHPEIIDPSMPKGKGKSFWSLAGQPTVFYNSGIAPMAPYALRGTIWYQGESNIADGDRYRLYLHALVKGWRKAFENPEMEFYTVQLMPYIYKKRGDTVLGEFWTAQQKFVAEDPHAAYVVTDDCGLLDEIHSPHKRTVGLRLSLCALNRCYGHEKLEYRSPVLKSATVLSNGVVSVVFDHARGGVYVPVYKGKVRNFELAGPDGVWHDAAGTIGRGFKLTVASEKVPCPKRIRYMYRQGMTGDLYARGSHLMPGAFVAEITKGSDPIRTVIRTVASP